MISNKVVRTICYFADNPGEEIVVRINKIASRLIENNYIIQTKRLCSLTKDCQNLENKISDKSILLSVGTLPFGEIEDQLEKFYLTENLSFNIDLSSGPINKSHIEILFDIIKNKPEKSFNFTYVFNNAYSSPYFPSANYRSNGFSIGFQPTDLSENCLSLEEWLGILKKTWLKINDLFKKDSDFLGIDSSIAPLFEGKSSLINFVKRLGLSFSHSITTDFYLKITEFIKQHNPKPIGLCGLMFPCLEDFELAQEYEKGNFSIERNVFLSLHCGLGIDTYPIGINESQTRALEILRLLQGLSNRYKKSLSARFVSDGKAKTGEKTDFQNQYLKDVIVRKL